MALPVSYNWRNLFIRKTTTLLTVLVIAVVVGVFAWLLGFRDALSKSLSFASDRQKLIVLRQASTSETNSAIPPDDYGKLTQLNQEVAVDPATGQQLKSPEMIVQVSLPRVRDGGKTNANVAVRGVTPEAFKVHQNIKLLGSNLNDGAMEVVVGVNAAKQFAGLKIGNMIHLGYSSNRDYKVVGYFSANSGPMESEIWGPLTSLMNSYMRTAYSSVELRLKENVDPKTVVTRIEGPAIEMTAQTEAEYWDAQAKNIRMYLGIVSLLVGIMCLAAAFSIANTMFAAVAGRTREFAMLRTIGFSKGQILLCILIEAVFLSLIGGVLGCLGCMGWLAFAGNTKDMFGASTFTTLAFEISLSPLTIGLAIFSVMAVGLIGSLLPAIRAARIPVVSALREV
jgi:putative ABC transport system permease protein